MSALLPSSNKCAVPASMVPASLSSSTACLAPSTSLSSHSSPRIQPLFVACRNGCQNGTRGLIIVAKDKSTRPQSLSRRTLIGGGTAAAWSLATFGGAGSLSGIFERNLALADTASATSDGKTRGMSLEQLKASTRNRETHLTWILLASA